MLRFYWHLLGVQQKRVEKNKTEIQNAKQIKVMLLRLVPQLEQGENPESHLLVPALPCNSSKTSKEPQRQGRTL